LHPERTANIVNNKTIRYITGPAWILNWPLSVERQAPPATQFNSQSEAVNHEIKMSATIFPTPTDCEWNKNREAYPGNQRTLCDKRFY